MEEMIMTHLRIEQNNGTTEDVSSSVVNKLYEIVSSGNLDKYSNLSGRINILSSTYLKYIDYLRTTCSNLTILNNFESYVWFKDLTVEQLLKQKYSITSEGIKPSLIGDDNVHYIPSDTFRNNTTITSFNELSEFTKITVILPFLFSGCSNLTSIKLDNITTILSNNNGDQGHFADCVNLISLGNTSHLTSLGRNATFANCSSLPKFDMNPSITTIPLYCFSGCTNLATFTGANNVTSLETECFRNCSSLTNIDIDWNKLTTLQNSAFQGCTNLNVSIVLSNVTSLGYYAFSSSGITSITFNQNISYLDNNIFLNCTSLTTANNIYKLSNSMFDGCSNLTTVTGLSNITSIPVHVFRSCGSLTSVDINFQNVTKIENNAFYDCSNLEFNSPLNLSSVTSIGVLMFYNCSKLVIDEFPKAQTYYAQAFYNIGNTTITIPKEVKQMDNLCFGYCANLTTVLFESDSLITSMTLTFRHCPNLTGTVDIPEGFTTSGGSVFYECYKLKHVIYPSTIISIGNAEFMYAYELVSVTVKATTPPTIVLGTFAHAPDNLIIYVPSESVSAYQSALYWSSYASKILAIPAS